MSVPKKRKSSSKTKKGRSHAALAKDSIISRAYFLKRRKRTLKNKKSTHKK